MEGKIVIKPGAESGMIEYEMRAHNISFWDKVMIFDSLGTVLELSEFDRMLLSYVVLRGMSNILGKNGSVEMSEVSLSILNKLKNKAKGCEPPENKL